MNALKLTVSTLHIIKCGTGNFFGSDLRSMESISKIWEQNT